jgi:putative N-acetyltransferase (TIGR04045 family)
MDILEPKGQNILAFQSPGYFIRAVSTAWETAGAFDLRKRVFVDEQGLFEHHDRDDIDTIATHLVAISTLAHEAHSVVGTVRIHQAEPGVWWGSRLAVDPEYRNVGRLGAELINLAVRSANARGCRLFNANVQLQNVILFRRMRWNCIEEVDCHGVAHMRMSAELSHYPPKYSPQDGWYHRPHKNAA